MTRPSPEKLREARQVSRLLPEHDVDAEAILAAIQRTTGKTNNQASPARRPGA